MKASLPFVLVLVILMELVGLPTHAANNLYRFSATTAAYTELSGDTNVTYPVFPDSFYTVTALAGKTYQLMGQPWTMDNTNRAVSILAGGRVYIGVDTGFALFDVLYNDSLRLIDASSKVSYKIEGATGSQVLKVQWKHIRIGTGPAGNFINVQMWLYQNGTVEFRYGPRSANNASGYTIPKDGIYIGAWYSNANYSKVYEKMNLSGTPPAISVDSVLNLNVPNIQGVPDSGTMYRFVPKVGTTGIDGRTGGRQLFEVYPNPASEYLHIRLAGGQTMGAHAYLLDVGGRRIAYGNEGNRRIDLETKCLPAGSYQLVVEGEGIADKRQIVICH